MFKLPESHATGELTANAGIRLAAISSKLSTLTQAAVWMNRCFASRYAFSGSICVWLGLYRRSRVTFNYKGAVYGAVSAGSGCRFCR